METHLHGLDVVIGLIAGLVPDLLMLGNDPGGFINTTVIGILGALLARRAGQRASHWYREGESTGLIASVLDAPGVCRPLLDESKTGLCEDSN
ncbi:MAG: GlsB/YeaQ/YmgE family stress response membrane protein [Rhodanobacter sp.]